MSGSDRSDGSGAGDQRPRDQMALPRTTRKRSIAKAISWRFVGTLDTLFLSFVVITFLGPVIGRGGETTNENLRVAGAIAVTEIVTKITLFFLHERAWIRTEWGVSLEGGLRRVTYARTIAKAATWRTIASLDTFTLALIFTGHVGTAISIGGLEILTKLALYFVHERIWVRFHYGLEKRH